MESVDEYISKHERYQKELSLLRSILISTGLDETVKWGAPAYTYKGKNLIGIAAFKSYCGLWFHHGNLLKDEAKVLVNAQEGVTKALRQWRFLSVEEIDQKLVSAYALEAIQNSEQGKVIKPQRLAKLVVLPEELQNAFKTNKTLENQFNALSNACQREYAEYISEAKKEETRIRRLEKIMPMILNGGGLNDKYKNC